MAATAGGCGYHSSYVPPDADHYRAVWRGTELAVIGPTTTASCDGVEVALVPPAATSVFVTNNHYYDEYDDDDDDSELGGSAAAIAALVLLSTAIAGTAVGLAVAPAGSSRNNANALQDMHLRNDALWRRGEDCDVDGVADGVIR